MFSGVDVGRVVVSIMDAREMDTYRYVYSMHEVGMNHFYSCLWTMNNVISSNLIGNLYIEKTKIRIIVCFESDLPQCKPPFAGL